MAFSWKHYLKYFWLGLFYVTSKAYFLVDYVVWMTLLTPLRMCAPSLYWRIEREIYYWLLVISSSWITFPGCRVMECGDNVECLQKEPCLLICNHQASADISVIAHSLLHKKRAGSQLMWTIYKPHKLSFLGIIGAHREDFFIGIGKDIREMELARLKKHLVDSFLALERKWLIIFPEGGYLCREKEVNKRYALRKNLPVFEHVLLPKVGAVQVTLSTVGEPNDPHKYDDSFSLGENGTKAHLTESTKANLLEYYNGKSDPLRPMKWIIDMTIAYKDKQALWVNKVGSGVSPCKDILVHWRAFRVKDVPHDESSLTTWLIDRYAEKEKMLEEYYTEGKIPGPSENSPFPPKKLEFITCSMWYQLMVHFAMIALFYLQYALVCRPLWAAVIFLFSSVVSFSKYDVS